MSSPLEAIEQHIKHEYEIIVNGRPKTVATRVLSFDAVVRLAFNPLPIGPNIVFTVSYRHAACEKPAGTLVEGQDITIKDGTVFHVTATDKS